MTPTQLKTIRRRLGLSQAALARKLGVSRNTVTRWEMGLHRIPLMAAHLIRRIAEEEKTT